MKKIILLLSLSLCTAWCYAQSTVSVGLKGGLNFSNFAGDNVNTDSRTGINFGAFGTYSIKETFGITAEINYAQKGAKTANSKLNINYLEIPLHFSFFFGKGDLRPKLMVGPYMGFLMNSDLEIGNTKVNAKTLYNDTDFGANVGGGLHYRVGDGQWLYLDARYGFGLADVTKASGNVFNRVFSINIGFSVALN
ncbi:MAG: porin family protein [Cytophagales bacterium]|nr:PorT family protein [Bernardetiaceae bacterium]MDW8205734.1 porin family protein [Cytophagales bacterium]